MSEQTVRLTRRQVREVDRRAIEEYHVPGIVLMENAARGAAEVAWEMLGRAPADVAVVCGGGNNGGDGLAVARHLHNRGCYVTVLLATEASHFRGDALTNLQIVQAIKHWSLQVGKAEPRDFSGRASLVIDAIFGTGLSKPIKGQVREVIDAMNDCRILAIDVPSGLDCDTGEPLGDCCVRAARTVTFVAEKAGFANLSSRRYTGDVIVAEIGCPGQIVAEVLRDIPA